MFTGFDRFTGRICIIDSREMDVGLEKASDGVLVMAGTLLGGILLSSWRSFFWTEV
jgi:hypothetical protein